MDEGLFVKHLRAIKVRLHAKEEVISSIHTACGIDMTDEEIHIQGKKVKIVTSSVKRSALLRAKVKEALSKIGYTVEI